MAAFKISVIIPYYNRPNLIVECLQSVAQQTLLPDEVIIIDDASTEPIPEGVLMQYRRLNIKVIQHRCRVGVSAARNTGLCEVAFDVIAYLDSDDIWMMTHLAQSVAALRQFPKVGFVFGADKIIDKQGILSAQALALKQQRRQCWKKYGTQIAPNHYQINQNTGLDLCLRPNKATIFTSTLVIKKARLHPFPFFDETLHILEDKDYYIRLFHSGDAIFLMTCQAHYRIHNENTISIYSLALSKRLPQLNGELKAIRKKLNYAKTEDQRKEIRLELAEQYYAVASAMIEDNMIVASYDWFKQSYLLKPQRSILKHLLLQKVLPINLLNKIYAYLGK